MAEPGDMKDIKFWQEKRLEELSGEEWEQLCDGCGACCLIQLQDEDTNKRYYTRLVCRLMDVGTCRCGDYPNRFERVPTCKALSYEMLATADWLPPTCAYRLLYEGHELFWWHPLISGDPNTVHEAGISVRAWCKSESAAGEEADYEQHIVEDPFADLRAVVKAQNRKNKKIFKK